MNHHRLGRSAALGLALAVLAASTASARPVDLRSQMRTSSLAGTTSAAPHRFVGSPDAYDLNHPRSTSSAPAVTVVRVTGPAPPGGGIDWGDAGIGAGGTLGLILLALGTTLVVVHRRRSAARGQPATTA
jgi:hypothetical protein